MEIVFLSNYYNHHQKSLAEKLFQITKGKFTFIEIEEMPNERITLGWGESEVPCYVIKYDENLKRLIDRADVAIIGSAPYSIVKERIANNKLTFVYSERIYKTQVSWIRKIFHSYLYSRLYPKKKNVFLLCASAFSYADYFGLHTMKNKAYKWGYFPETKKYDIETLLNKKKPHSILWVARFINWKHPEICIELAKRLLADGINDFTIDMIGTGQMVEQIKTQIVSNHLEDYISVLGSMRPSEVREYMEKSEIFLFTSDRNEGWGAVLNEAMNSGCVVVASSEIGAVPFLIKDDENGLIYQDGNTDDLFCKIKKIYNYPIQKKRIGAAAFRTITDLWNAEIAANRLLLLIDDIKKNGASDCFSTGPCSKAEIIRDGWYK